MHKESTKVNLEKKIRFTLYFKKPKLLKDCVMGCHLKMSRAKAKGGIVSISELILFLWKKTFVLSEKHWCEVLWIEGQEASNEIEASPFCSGT